MPEREPADIKNLDRYGNAPLPWSRPRDLLAGSVPGPEVAMFLSTTRPDGRPHTAGIGALWHDGDLYFTSNPDTRKSRDAVQRPECRSTTVGTSTAARSTQSSGWRARSRTAPPAGASRPDLGAVRSRTGGGSDLALHDRDRIEAILVDFPGEHRGSIRRYLVAFF